MTLPSDFVCMMSDQLGEVRASALCEALLSTEPSVSVRLNPFKPVSSSTLPLAGEQVPWCPDAYYLHERPSFTFDPLLHAGAYYVQDASSMFLAEILRQHAHDARCVLDLCAAPGGKSTLLRSHLPDEALLVSNEPIRQRAQILSENMTKWGHPSTIVTQNYPADFSFLCDAFDVIVADVPCSGEGMFRKDEEAVSEWSRANVELCWKRQREIIRDVWPALRPKGLLVYSTCTFNRQENEDNVQWIAAELEAEILSVKTQQEWGIEGAYHFFPDKVRGEGQYMAALRKKHATSHQPSMHVASTRTARRNGSHDTLSFHKWLSGDFDFFREGDACIAFPKPHVTFRETLARRLNVLSQGVQVAEPKGRDWLPSHSLAMSTAYARGIFPEYELSYETALCYLRHEAIQVDAPRGIVLVTFRGLPLGFVKNLGTRANNLYPQEWRIRSGYISPFTLFQ